MEIEKLMDKTYHNLNKVLKDYTKLDGKTFLEEITPDITLIYPEGAYNSIGENRSIVVQSTIKRKVDIRQAMLDTLLDVSFERDNNWSETSVVAFIHSVISMYFYTEGYVNNINMAKIYENVIEDSNLISKTFNVPVNRLNTQTALFLQNWHKGNDNFNLDRYFTPYELLLWKYRDPLKLQEDVENEKLTEFEFNILKEIVFVGL